MSTTEPAPLPYGRQWIDAADIAAVEAVLRSDWLTQGPAVPRFEAALTDLTGAGHAVAVSNATAALHIACLALGAGPGDAVWTSPNSFVASANCALYCGATIDFVDIEPATGNMSAAALAAKLARAEAEGRLPRIVIPVHFAGQSCDMGEIGALAARYGVRVIEDASHAIGGSWGGAAIGAGRHSDVTVFSFHPVKIVTTGEGGAALTNDAGLAERLRLLRSHGVTREPHLMAGPAEGPWDYDQVALGFNYRMTDMQAALGTSQLGRIGDFIDRRHALAARYDRALAGLPLTPLARPAGGRSALHLYVVRLDDPGRRKEAFEHLVAGRIFPQVHYIPIHTQPYYAALGFRAGDFPVAEDHYARALTLPLHPQMGEADIDRVAARLAEALA